MKYRILIETQNKTSKYYPQVKRWCMWWDIIQDITPPCHWVENKAIAEYYIVEHFNRRKIYTVIPHKDLFK